MKYFSLTVLLIVNSLLTIAQQANVELKSLINRSFTYYAQFRELNQAAETAKDRINLAKSEQLPIISASGMYSYTNPISEIEFPSGNGISKLKKIAPVNSIRTGLNANYVLYDFGRIKANVDRAKQDLQFAKDNINFNKSQMAYLVSVIYYQIVYFRKSIAIQDSVINFLDANKIDTKIKLSHGDALTYDVLSIQSQIDLEHNRKIDLENSLNKQYNLLEYSTGKRQTDQSVTFDFLLISDSLNDQTYLTNAQTNNWDFKLSNDKIQQSEANLKISRTLGKPFVSLGAGTGYANGYLPDLNTFRYNYTAGASLNIPLYMGGRARKQVMVSQSELRQAELGYETLTSSYLKDIRQALTDQKSNSQSLINAREQVAVAKETQRLSQSRYKNGIGTNLELTNASTNVQRAELSILQYEFQLCLANLELARLTGIVYW